jgi:hypothetical protein
MAILPAQTAHVTNAGKNERDGRLRMKFLSKSELESLSTKRLLTHLKFVNIKLSSIYNYCGARCCEICREYVGSDWEKDVGQHAKPVEEYKKLVKSVLATREHITRHTRKPTVKRIKLRRSSRGRGRYTEKQR